MRIAYLTAGAGAMHCGACARDVGLVRALAARGCDVLLVPLYTPPKLDGDPPPGMTRTFLGGLNVFLQQHLPFFRAPHPLLDRFLDGPGILALVSQFGVRTRPEGLGAMTLSVLRGEEGFQRREVEKLLDFLAARPRPDVVNLTNSLLSGLAAPLKRHQGTRVVCTLQGEDGFVASIPEPYRTKVRNAMRQNAREVDVFVAPSEAYADRMAAFLDVPRKAVAVVRNGIDTGPYPPVSRRRRRPFTIGCLSRITPGKGLDVLAEAFRLLVENEGRDVRLRVAGRKADGAFWRSVRQNLRRPKLADRVRYWGELGYEDKLDFLRGCSVFVQPSRYAELRGTAAMEAMAVGVPVVASDSGVFPELVRRTGGGRLFPSGDATALAAELGALMDRPSEADALGLAAAEGIRVHYRADTMAQATLDIYTGLIGKEYA